MSLMAAVLRFSRIPAVCTNATLRTQVAHLRGPDASYGTRQTTYDLRRLRLTLYWTDTIRELASTGQ